MDYIELADDFNPTDDDMKAYKIKIIKAPELGDQKFERDLPEEFATTARALDDNGGPQVGKIIKGAIPTYSNT